MFATRRRRGVIIAVVVATMVVAGLALRAAADRALDDQAEALTATIEARSAALTTSELRRIMLDELLSGGSAELTDLLDVDGQEPRGVALFVDGFEATYVLEAWGGSTEVVVTRRGEDLTIVRGPGP